MITGELKNKVDKIWDTLWTAGVTSPVTVLEQITYLLFMKLLDDNQTRQEANAAAWGRSVQSPVFREGVCIVSETPRVEIEYAKLRWKHFHDLAPEEMLGVVRDFVFPFIKSIGQGRDTAFSRYMKDAVFLIPRPDVLDRVVRGIDAMDLDNKDIMGDVYEYLLRKMGSSGKMGEFRTPRHIIRMMVELMNPTPEDEMCDPAMGSAGFLVECVSHVAERHRQALLKPDVRKRFATTMFSGFDTDLSMLRIGAMNMMLHGVEEPRMEYRDSLSDQNPDRGRYSLIMANPPFSGSVFATNISKDLLALCPTKKTELLFLALFVKSLRLGGRCASVVPDGVLFGSSKAHKALRRELVDRQKLEAVISMPSGVFKPYAGVSTAILVFTRTDAGGTDKVWFYDMEADGFSLDDKRSPVAKNDIPDIIARFHARAEEPNDDRAAKHFFVPRDEIAASDYDLSVNKYKKVEYVAEALPPPREILANLARLEGEIQAGLKELEGMLGRGRGLKPAAPTPPPGAGKEAGA